MPTTVLLCIGYIVQECWEWVTLYALCWMANLCDLTRYFAQWVYCTVLLLELENARFSEQPANYVLTITSYVQWRYDQVHLLQWFILHRQLSLYHCLHFTTPPLTLAIHTCTHMIFYSLSTLLHYSLYIAKRWWAYYMSHQNRPTLPSVVSHWGALGRNGPLKLQCDLCKIPIIGWSDGTKMVDRNVQTKLS